MASFVREAGSDLTPEEHSNQIFRESLKLMSLKGLIGGKGEGNVIIIDNMLMNKSGDTIDYHYVPYANKPPIKGQDATIQGNEYSFDEYSTQLTIDEVNFPFKKRGKMTDQRTILNARAELGRQIAQHNSEYNEDQLFKIMTGGGSNEELSVIQDSTNTTDRVNGANRCIAASGSSAFSVRTEAQSDNVALFAAVTATDKISPALIKRAAVMARTGVPYKMKPLRVGPQNAEMFVLYVSLETSFDLTQHPDWITHALSTTDKGFGDDPIATNALGVFGNVIVKESERIIKVTDGSRSISRNLLMGSDGAVLGFAQTLDLQEQWNDYRRELGINGSEIRGEVKLAFTNKDVSKTNDTANDIDHGIAQLITASD